MTLPDDLKLIPGPSEVFLNNRQRLDYEEHRKDLLEWLATLGKQPEKASGYSQAVVRNTGYRLDQIYRWVWGREGYTTDIQHEHADHYVRTLAGREISNASKAKYVMSLKRLFKWQHHVRGGELWESEIAFSTGNGVSNPRDFFTRTERTKLREAALEYGAIPRYNDLAPSERDRWKQHLSQRFGKPITEVSPEDWERANGWKVPSLVWTSLDCGLRPIEVERARVDWVDTSNGVIRIPREESSKNRDNWIAGLTERTTEALTRWLQERENYSKYDDTSSLWLTREGNPYTSQSLRYLIRRLCEEAGISTSGRKISWYAIRHSVGTYMTREEDLAAAASQMRHKSIQTTMKYDNTPIEDRKKALERMG